jgi:alanine dehydrogenase
MPPGSSSKDRELIPGSTAPRLVSREMLKKMKRGAVIVDVSIDQGECFETSKVTTHHSPTYEVEGVIHYSWRICPVPCR